MSKVVARTQKVKSGNLIGIGNHNQRKFENHSNEDIDPEKKNLNYDLVEGRTENYKTDIEKFINEKKSTSRAVRKDAVLINEWLISSDQVFFEKFSAERTREFFEAAKDYFAEKYGDQNIRYAEVHLDETTPHMHMGVVPFDKDNKLSAKRLFNKIALKEIQAELPEYLKERGFDIERGEKDSERKNLSVPEYKKAMQERELLEKEAEALQNTKNVLEGKIEPLESRLETIESKVETNRDILSKQSETFEKQKRWQQNFSGASSLGNTMQEVKKYKAYVPKKNALGITVIQEEPRLVSIKKEEYDSFNLELTRAHQARLIAERRLDEERSEKAEAEKFADKFLRERNQQTESANYWMGYSDELEKEKKELKQENIVLQEKVNKVDKAFDNMHKAIDQNIPEGKMKVWLLDVVEKTKNWVDERQPVERNRTRDRDEWER